MARFRFWHKNILISFLMVVKKYTAIHCVQYEFSTNQIKTVSNNLLINRVLFICTEHNLIYYVTINMHYNIKSTHFQELLNG